MLPDVRPDDFLSAEIARIEQDLAELKQRQFIGGDNIQMKLTTTNNTWDVDTTVPPSAGITWWQVTFEPVNGITPYGQFTYDYLVTPDSGFEYFSHCPSPLDNGPNKLAWIVEYSNPNLSSVNVKLKFGVKSLDPGTLAWSIVRQTS